MPFRKLLYTTCILPRHPSGEENVTLMLNKEGSFDGTTGECQALALIGSSPSTALAVQYCSA